MTTTPATTPGAVPPEPRADATNRAVRTLAQGLLFDLAVVLLPIMYDLASGWDGSFDAAHWRLVGLSLLKTIVVTAIAYVMRLVRTPPGNRPA